MKTVNFTITLDFHDWNGTPFDENRTDEFIEFLEEHLIQTPILGDNDDESDMISVEEWQIANLKFKD